MPANAAKFRKKTQRGEGDLKRQHPAKKTFPARFDHFDDKQRQRNDDEIVDEIVDQHFGVLPKNLRRRHQRMQKALPEDQPKGIEKREQAEVHQAPVGGLSLEKKQSQAGEAERQNHDAHGKTRELPAQLGNGWQLESRSQREKSGKV